MRIRVQNTCNRTEGNALSGSRFADEAQDLARTNFEIDSVHRPKHPPGGLKGDLETVHAEQRFDADHHRFTSSRSARPSPVRLKPRPQSTIASPGKKHIQG